VKTSISIFQPRHLSSLSRAKTYQANVRTIKKAAVLFQEQTSAKIKREYNKMSLAHKIEKQTNHQPIKTVTLEQ
jgi:hypothetical protein